MICPKCKYEYRDGISTCPDCESELVAVLPQAPVAQAIDGSWISVCAVPTVIKSELARGALDSNNIPSIIVSNAFGAAGHNVGFNASITPTMAEKNMLMVPREFRLDAVIILSAVLGEDFVEIND